MSSKNWTVRGKGHRCKCSRVGIRSIAVAGFLFCSISAHAQFNWNAYGTVGFGKVDDQSVVANSNLAYSNFTESFRGDELTRFGIQPSYKFSDQFSLTLQAVTRQSKDFDLEIEWGYFNYAFSSNNSVRFGLIRRPLFQYSDSVFVGYGTRWVHPPLTAYLDIDELYGNISALNFLHNGAYGNWLYSAELYLGQGSGEGSFAGLETSNKSDHNVGIVLNVEHSNYAFRLGIHESDFAISIKQLDLLAQSLRQFGLNELADSILLQDETARFYSVSGSYFSDDWEFYGEKAMVDIEDTAVPKIDGWYIGVQRSFGDIAIHFTTGEQITRSQIDPSADIAALAAQAPDALAAGAILQIGQQLAPVIQGGNARRTSNSIGLRYDLHSNIALKADLERVTDKLNNSSANLISISMDFIY